MNQLNRFTMVAALMLATPALAEWNYLPQWGWTRGPVLTYSAPQFNRPPPPPPPSYPRNTPTFTFSSSSSSSSAPAAYSPRRSTYGSSDSAPSQPERARLAALLEKNDVAAVKALLAGSSRPTTSEVDEALPRADSLEMLDLLRPLASRAGLEQALKDFVSYSWRRPLLVRRLLEADHLSPNLVRAEHHSARYQSADCDTLLGRRRRGQPLIFVALERKSGEMIDILESHGADLDAKDGCGKTLADYAAADRDAMALYSVALHRRAIRYEHGDGVPRDPAKAAALVETACENGLAHACYALARKKLTAGDSGAALELLRKSCPAAPESCGWLAHLLEGNHGVSKDAAGAQKAADQGCDAYDGQSCRLLATMLRASNDQWGAGMALWKGCSKGDGASCHLRAVDALADEKQKPAERAKYALSIDEQGCKMGSQVACVGLASLHLDGATGKRDAALAFELASQACAKDLGTGCFMAGAIIERAGGRAGNDAAAQALFERGCRLDDALSCAAASALAARGGKKSAAELGRRACAAGYQPACRGPLKLPPAATPSKELAADFDPATVKRAKDNVIGAQTLPASAVTSDYLSKLGSYSAPAGGAADCSFSAADTRDKLALFDGLACSILQLVRAQAQKDNLADPFANKAAIDALAARPLSGLSGAACVPASFVRSLSANDRDGLRFDLREYEKERDLHCP
jgi:TPR repeat protein